jgi:hypothetical protein
LFAPRTIKQAKGFSCRKQFEESDSCINVGRPRRREVALPHKKKLALVLSQFRAAKLTPQLSQTFNGCRQRPTDQHFPVLLGRFESVLLAAGVEVVSG